MSEAAQERITAYWSAHEPAYDASRIEREERPGTRVVWARVWSAAFPTAPPDAECRCGTASARGVRGHHDGLRPLMK